MALIKNKRGVEALPLRYIIIALVAALVIGIAMQFVGILKTTTIGAANQYSQTTNKTIICETDTSNPVISYTAGNINCNSTTNVITVSNVLVTDNCGVDWVKIEFKNSAGNYTGLGDLTNSSNGWGGTLDFSSASNPNIFPPAYDIKSGDLVVIWAKDTADQPNYATTQTTVNCTS